jgi:hypothetical protein
MKNANAASEGTQRQLMRERGIMGANPEVLPVVEMDAENATGFAEVTATEVEERLHFAPVGAPVQVSEIVPVNPVPGLSCKLYCAV